MSTFADQTYAAEPMTESRLSKSSLGSLIVSIISIVCCPIGSLIGFLGLLLGIIGLMRTSAVGVHGRGLAISGIVLGLIGMVIGTGLMIGFSQAMARVVEPADETITSLHGGDVATFRANLSSRLDNQVTDEQIAAFRDMVEGDYGALVKTPASAWEWFTMALEAGQPMQAAQSQQLVPIAAEFDGGMVVYLFKPPSGGGDSFMDDVGYVKPDGTTVWLSEIEP